MRIPIVMLAGVLLVSACSSKGAAPHPSRQSESTRSVEDIEAGAPVTTVSAAATGERHGSRIADLRLAHHAGFDRLVVEFTRNVPDVWAEFEDEPYQDECPYKRPAGAVFLNLTMHGASTLDPYAEQPFYEGPSRVRAETTNMTEAVLACDTHGVVSMVVGVRLRQPMRVHELANPPRLVIDVEAP